MLMINIPRGQASVTRRSPLQVVASHPLLRAPRPRPLIRVNVTVRRGNHLGPQAATKIMKSPRQPRVRKGLRGAKLIEQRVNAVMRRLNPSKVIGKKRGIDQISFTSKPRQSKRVCVIGVHKGLPEDVKKQLSLHARSLVLENRAATRRSWWTGARDWSIDPLTSINGSDLPLATNIEEAVMDLDEDASMLVDLDSKCDEDDMETESTAALEHSTATPVTPVHNTIVSATPPAPYVAYSKQMELDVQSQVPNPEPQVKIYSTCEQPVKSRVCQPVNGRKVNSATDFTITKPATVICDTTNLSAHTSTKVSAAHLDLAPPALVMSPSSATKPRNGVTSFSLVKDTSRTEDQSSNLSVIPSSLPAESKPIQAAQALIQKEEQMEELQEGSKDEDESMEDILLHMSKPATSETIESPSVEEVQGKQQAQQKKQSAQVKTTLNRKNTKGGVRKASSTNLSSRNKAPQPGKMSDKISNMNLASFMRFSQRREAEEKLQHEEANRKIDKLAEPESGAELTDLDKFDFTACMNAHRQDMLEDSMSSQINLDGGTTQSKSQSAMQQATMQLWLSQKRTIEAVTIHGGAIGA